MKMQADLLVTPYHSLEYRKLQKAILQEEYRIDGFNNSGGGRRPEDKEAMSSRSRLPSLAALEAAQRAHPAP